MIKKITLLAGLMLTSLSLQAATPKQD
ncbi:uncharacterized protein METZ01_LOCUS336480, partial [marine metagenome]